MAMPKKKARSIVVDGVAYHWCANLKGSAGDLKITCQHNSGRGAILLVKAKHVDHWYRISIETGKFGKSELPLQSEIDVATPRFVQSAIRFALRSGWNPSRNGPPTVLRYESESFHEIKDQA